MGNVLRFWFLAELLIYKTKITFWWRISLALEFRSQCHIFRCDLSHAWYVRLLTFLWSKQKFVAIFTTCHIYQLIKFINWSYSSTDHTYQLIKKGYVGEPPRTRGSGGVFANECRQSINRPWAPARRFLAYPKIHIFGAFFQTHPKSRRSRHLAAPWPPNVAFLWFWHQF